SRPTAEWMERERERLLAHLDPDGEHFLPTVQEMYAESLRLSPRWAKEFRDFWRLPDDFDFPVRTPTVEISRRILGDRLGASSMEPPTTDPIVRGPVRSSGGAVEVTERTLEE